MAQTGFMLAAAGLPVVFRGPARSPIGWLAGVPLLALGAAVGIAGAFALRSNRTPFPKPQAGSQLVRHGIYAKIRHPLYTSLILLSLGWACVWQSGPGLLFTVGFAVFLRAKAAREERWLREHFPEYAAYERRVPRFCPGIKR